MRRLIAKSRAQKKAEQFIFIAADIMRQTRKAALF